MKLSLKATMSTVLPISPEKLSESLIAQGLKCLLCQVTHYSESDLIYERTSYFTQYLMTVLSLIKNRPENIRSTIEGS